MKALSIAGIAFATLVTVGPLTAQTHPQAAVPGVVQAVPDTGKGDTAGYTGNATANIGSTRPGVQSAGATHGLPIDGGAMNRNSGSGHGAQGKHDDASVTRSPGSNRMNGSGNGTGPMTK